MGKVFLHLTLAGVLTLPLSSFGVVCDVFLKKGGKVLNLHREGKNLVVEETGIGENLPLFKTFEVKVEGGKLLLEWKPSDPSVERVLIVTDTGKVETLTSRRVEIPTNHLGEIIRVYPIGSNGEIGLPAEVRLGG